MIDAPLEDDREPPRQVWHLFLLAAVLFAILGSEFLGSRPLMYGVFNNVAPAGRAPSELTPVDWSVAIHRSDWAPPVAALLGHTRPGRPARLGWVVREWSVFSLPLFAWRQSEVCVYTEGGFGYWLSGLTEDQRRDVERRGLVGWFPWWRFAWGWLVLAGFAGFVWGEVQWQARRRALLGII